MRRILGRWTVLDLLGRLAAAGGIACVLLARQHAAWWIGAAVLAPVAVFGFIAGARAESHRGADEALAAAAEYDRLHAPEDGAEPDHDAR